jgi:hypothetical protein
METSSQIQKDMEATKKHHESQLADIRAKIDAREARGQNHGDLDKALSNMRSLAETSEAHFAKKLFDAKASEAAQESSAAARLKVNADSIEADRKAQAARLWKTNGGLPADFEAAWPAMRAEILRAVIVGAVGKEARAGFPGMSL